MSNVAHAETWDVEIADGVVHTMTLDELDAAYQRGLVHDTTPVRQSGAPNWSTLAAIAGEDESETAGPVSARHHHNSLSPMQVTVPPPPGVPRELAHLDDLDDDELRLRPKRKPLAVAGGIVGVAALAGLVAFGATRAGAPDLSKVNAASAMKAPEEAKPLPEPASDTATDKRNLSDEQRRALLEADKRRSAEADKKRAKSAPRAAAPRAGKVNDGLVTGGDKYDPLNGSL